MARLSREAIDQMGFAAVGSNAQISDRASFYNCANISIGDDVRIDDFCVLSAGRGGITIGSYIHIAVFTSLIGDGMISLGNFCNLSSRVALYSSTDDFSGTAMTNPMISQEFTNVRSAPVILHQHVVIGTGSVVLPGVTMHEGAALGALSMVKDDCNSFTIYAGTPAKAVRDRKRDLLTLTRAFLASKIVK